MCTHHQHIYGYSPYHDQVEFFIIFTTILVKKNGKNLIFDMTLFKKFLQ